MAPQSLNLTLNRSPCPQIIVEDVSNPGKPEVVPSIGDSHQDDEEEDQMQEETGWNPFGYRRLQDLPVRLAGWLPACRGRGRRGSACVRPQSDSPKTCTRLNQGAVMTDVLANWTNPPNADDPDAWKKVRTTPKTNAPGWTNGCAV